MSRRNTALVILLAGFACEIVAGRASIESTGLNAALTGVAVLLMAVGLLQLWRAGDRS